MPSLRDHFSIGLWLERMGWKNFYCLNIPMYPRLVREFYANLRRGADDVATTIKGIHFEVSKNILAHVFGLPRDRIVPERMFDKRIALRVIVGREDVVRGILAPSLSVEMKILHHIIGGIFIP